MTLTNTTKEIQRIVGVASDGIYGPNTAAAILARLRASAPPIKPDDTDFDPRTERNLATLLPEAQAKLRPFVRHAMGVAASLGCDLKVICGLRGKADQEKAKASGASRAGWGYSWHNYGVAIDFGVFKGASYLDSQDPSTASKIYNAVGAIAGDFGVEWGGSWRTFKDEPHFGLNMGRSSPNAKDRALFFDGERVFLG